MPASGTRTFPEPDHYEAALRQNQIDAVVTPHGRFEARLTWAELHHLQLLRSEEEFSRIAYLSLPSQAFVAFAIHCDRSPLWGGTELEDRHIVFHSAGERFHHATFGACGWGTISLDPVLLARHGQTLFEKPAFQPLAGQILQPAKRQLARLRRRFGQVCRLAETKPRILTHPEVARALERDLILALAECLASAEVKSGSSAKRRHARIMINFEEVLSQYLSRPLEVSDFGQLIGVSGRALAACCAEFIGASPRRYLLLRRLRQVRIALREADPVTADVAEIARAGGFSEIRQFANAYHATFGEAPSATLERGAQKIFGSR